MSTPEHAPWLTIKSQLILVEARAHQLGCEFDDGSELDSDSELDADCGLDAAVPPARGTEYKPASEQLDVVAESLAGVGMVAWQGETGQNFTTQMATLNRVLQEAAPLDLGMFHVIETQALAIMAARRELRAIHARLLAASAEVKTFEAEARFTEAAAVEFAAAAQGEADRNTAWDTLKAATAANSACVTESTAALDVLSDEVDVPPGRLTSGGGSVSVEPETLTRLASASVLGGCSEDLRAQLVVGTKVLEEVWLTHGTGVTDAFKQALATYTSARATILSRIRTKVDACVAALPRISSVYQSSDQSAASTVTRI